MMLRFSFILLLLLNTLFENNYAYKFDNPTVSLSNRKNDYETKYFPTLLDHFTYKNDSEKFLMKYLISTKNWVKGNAILFYCGNEGNIELFANNSGFVWELGEQLSAMVVFAEHRFYGTSLPYGNMSFSNAKYFGYLNSEQALADYVTLLNYLKSTTDGAKLSPVIAFGGSYGGMLAAWMRQKYPNIVAGSLAASAPVLMVGRIANCSTAFQILTNAFRTKGSDICVSNVRNVWPVIQNMNNTVGFDNLTRIFKLCAPLKNTDDLISYLMDGLFSMGMANYPYPTDFLGPMPAWPVTEFCKPLSNLIKDPIKLLTAFDVGIQVYFNYTGQNRCLGHKSIRSGSLDANAWDIQTCTELPIPMCSDGVIDMFLPINFSKIDNDRQCQKKFDVTPRWGWGESLFWGSRLESASNIIFSNGFLDPWAAGGVFNTKSSSVKIITIPNGAHHIDLRSSNYLDTSDIRSARKLEKLTIESWIKEWGRR